MALDPNTIQVPQNILDQFKALQQRIATEGITSNTGQIIAKPNDYNPTTNTFASLQTPPPPSKTSAVITSDLSKPSDNPIDVKTQVPTPPFDVNTIPDALKKEATTISPAETNIQTMLKGIVSSNDQLLGKSAFTTEQEKLAGMPALEQTQQDLQTQLDQLKKEALAIPLQLQNDAEGRGITKGGLAPIETGRLRTNAIASLGISAQIDATNGLLSSAQKKVDRLVQEKYGPVEEQIAVAKDNLNTLLKDPQLTVDEKNRAAAQLEIQNMKQATLDKTRADEVASLKVMTDAAANVSSFVATPEYQTAAQALDAISKSSPQKAIEIAVATGMVKPQTGTSAANTSIVEVGGRKLLINDLTGATIKDLGAALSSSSGNNSTKEERVTAALATFQASFVPGALYNGIPIVGSDGKMNPKVWNAAIADAPSKGVNRATFIENFGYLVNKADPQDYGLTPIEIQNIFGKPTS